MMSLKITQKFSALFPSINYNTAIITYTVSPGGMQCPGILYGIDYITFAKISNCIFKVHKFNFELLPLDKLCMLLDGYKAFFMLNSAEHEIHPANKY